MDETKQPAQGEKKQEPKRIKQNALTRTFKDIKSLNSDDIRFCFLIGAGASKNSGIPTGSELAATWYNELSTDEEISKDEIKKWEKELDTIFNPKENIGEFYTQLYEKRYETNPQVGYEYFQRLMEKNEPSLGYVILAQILAKEKHNFVITTNFDYLIEDAIRTYTDKKPFVAGHETLAEFITAQTERPTIIKVHRDLFLHPFNSDKETCKLKDEWIKALTPILKNFHLLVIGYGGNDGSLMSFLKEIKPENRLPIYWCVRNEDKINKKVEDLLESKDFIVEINDFDESMCSLYKALDYKIFNEYATDKHPFVLAAKKRIEDLNNKFNELISKRQQNKEEIPTDIKQIATGASKYLIKALEEKDPLKKEQIFKEGLKEYSKDASLNAWFASFLFELEKTEEGNSYYENAIKLKENAYDTYNNWGADLGKLAETKNGIEAEKLYLEACEKFKKAIDINPNLPEAYNNWGNALGNFAKAKNGMEAEELYLEAFEKYKKAIDIKPNFASAYNNWGSDLGNFAETKTGIEAKKLYLEASEKFKKAIDIKQDYADAYNNWGNALGNFAKTKTGNEAEKLYLEAFEKYQKAIEIKPDYADAYNNWGSDLGNLAKTKTGNEAEKLYLEAFDKYQKAIEIKPDYAYAYNNWANTLISQSKQKQNEAEKETLYNQALALSQKGYELGGGCYNLACAYALKQDKGNALHYLEIALTNKEVTLEHVQKDDPDWNFYQKDEDFKRLLEGFE